MSASFPDGPRPPPGAAWLQEAAERTRGTVRCFEGLFAPAHTAVPGALVPRRLGTPLVSTLQAGKQSLARIKHSALRSKPAIQAAVSGVTWEDRG